MMQVAINYAVALAALVALVPYLDRLRVMDWRSHRRIAIAAHLALAVFLGRIAFDGLFELTVGWPSGFGVAGAVLWAWLSRKTWRNVPLPFMDTQAEPEPARFRQAVAGRGRQ
jgi:hypothetical protein